MREYDIIITSVGVTHAESLQMQNIIPVTDVANVVN